MGLFSFISKLIGGSGPQQKIEISKSSAADGLPIIYGRRRVEAINVFKRVSSNAISATPGQYGEDHYAKAAANKDDSGIDRPNVWLHRIDVWGQGEIQGIRRYWVDGDEITHKRFFPRPYFRALTKYGSETQTAFTALASASDSQWGAAHRGSGVAYSWTRFFNSKNKPQFTSEPELKAEIDGLRLYDPRLDSSVPGGSGGHNFNDASTWAFSNNRALVVLNYLMGDFGFGADRDELVLGSFIVAANLCDSSMDIPLPPTNQTGVLDYCYNRQTGEIDSVAPNGFYPCYRIYQPPAATTQPRYVADAVIDPKTGVVENVKRLLEGFGWSLAWSNGQHRLVIEDLVAAPAMTFDAQTILGGWDIQRSNRADRYNRVTVEFPNANKNYEQDTVSWPPLRGAEHNAFLAADGGRDLHTNISLRTVTDAYRATAFAEYKVRKSRASEHISGLRLAPIAMLLEPGDVIALDYPDKGYQVVGSEAYENGDAWFIVERINISSTLDVSVDLRVYDPTVYGGTVPEPEQVNYGDLGPNPWLDPEAITNLNGAEYHTKKADGSVVSGIYLTWDAPTANVAIDHIEVKWRDTSDANLSGDNYGGMQVLPEEATAFRIPNLVDLKTYEIVVTYITRLSQRSIEATITVDLSVAPDSKLDLIEEGATRTAFTGPYDADTAYVRGDVVFFEGASYVALDGVQGIAPTDAAHWILLASAGVTGGFFKNIFRRFATQPTTPTGASPSGWQDAPPAPNGQPLWMALGLHENDGSFIGPWSTPSEIGGSGVEIEYSITGSNPSSSSGTNGWHVPPFVNGDKYMRQRLSGGAWSAAIQIVGEKGDPGAPGANGQNGAPGANGQNGDDGQDGDDGFSINASPAVITVLTTSNGVAKAGQLPATSQIQLLQGTVDRTSPASYSRTAVNCSATVNSSGLVTISSVASDSGYVEVTASYGGASIKIRITFVKARQGDAATSVEVSANTVNSTTYGVAAGPVSLALGTGGTVELDGFLTYNSSPDSNSQTVKFQYSSNNGSSWTDVGSEAFGSGSSTDFGFPGVAEISRSRSGPSSPATWQFRMMARKTGGTITEFGSASNMRVQWT